MSLMKHVIQRAAVERLDELRHLAAFPLAAQEHVLRGLVRRVRKSKFGRDHDLDRVNTYEDFRAAVPLRDYGAYAPYFDAARGGEPDVFWPGRIKHWALSSGTTAGEKYLPISRETIRTNRTGGCDSLVPYMAHARNSLFGGKLLFLGGSTELRREGEAWLGDCTGIMARYIPRLIKHWHTPSADTIALGDWEEKIRRAAQATVGQDLRMLSGIPSWILLFCEAALAEARRRKMPADCLLDIWPELGLYVHGGMAFGPYRHRFMELVGEPLWCTDTYSASEGGMLAVQDHQTDPGMLPLVDQGTFFEFVPREEVGTPKPTRLRIHEVERGVDYAVVLTTDSGIFGYMVGDLVRFTSLHPLRLVFAGRVAHTLNAFGEHVCGGELDRAVLAAAEVTGARVKEFAVATLYPGADNPTGRHVYSIEFERRPDDMAAFETTLDNSISRGNEDYTAHRHGNFGIAPPRVQSLPPDAFYEWMRARGRVGGQNKIPRVLTPELAGDLVAHLGLPEPAPVVFRDA